MMTADHICPYSIKAKDLLEQNGFDVNYINLRTRDEVDAFKAEHDVKTTSQIFGVAIWMLANQF